MIHVLCLVKGIGNPTNLDVSNSCLSKKWIGDKFFPQIQEKATTNTENMVSSGYVFWDKYLKSIVSERNCSVRKHCYEMNLFLQVFL